MCRVFSLNHLIGQKFGFLTILEDAGTINGERRLKVLCACGETTTIRYDKITKNGYGSCGCNGRTIRNIKKSPLYQVWTSMKKRCFNPKCECYMNYGGRGISVCDEWKNSVESFINWALGNGYTSGLQLDRKNNDGNYEPGNCRFVTSKVNNRNRRSNRFITYMGKTLTVSEWSEQTDIHKSKILWRLKKNWDIEQVLTIK